MARLANFSPARLARGADAWLLRRGFSTRTLRAIALCEIAGCALLMLLSLALLALPLTRLAGLWLFWFSLGAVALMVSGSLSATLNVSAGIQPQFAIGALSIGAD